MGESVNNLNQLTKSKFFQSFLKWVSTAGMSTILDFSVLTFTKEILGFYYLFSVALGALSGGTLSFLLGRNWVFFNKINSIFGQAGRYLMTNLGSISLNTMGVYLLTEVVSNNHYLISKVIVAAMIGIFYNFPMQKFFVFKRRN